MAISLKGVVRFRQESLKPGKTKVPTLPTLQNQNKKTVKKIRGSERSEKSDESSIRKKLPHDFSQKIFVNGVGTYSEDSKAASSAKQYELYKSQKGVTESEAREYSANQEMAMDHMYTLAKRRDLRELDANTTLEGQVTRENAMESPKTKARLSKEQLRQSYRNAFSKCNHCPINPLPDPYSLKKPALPDSLKFKETTYSRPGFTPCADISVPWFPKTAADEAKDEKALFEKRFYSFRMAGPPDMLPIKDYGARHTFNYRYCSAGPTKSNKTPYETEIERMKEVVAKADGDWDNSAQDPKNIRLYPRYTSRSLEESLRVLAEPCDPNTSKFDHEKICKKLYVPFKATNEFSSYVIDELYPNWKKDPRYKRKIFYKSFETHEPTTQYKPRR